MAILRSTLWLALWLLLATPSIAAQGAPQSTVRLSTDGLTVELPCPAGGFPAVTIDGEARASVAAPASPEPLALALVVETTAAMAEPGTPYSTRFDDTALLATALLDRLPADSRVAVIAFDTTARVVLPLSAEQLAARHAVAGLAPRPSTNLASPPPYALGEALNLALAELRPAPPLPRILIVMATGGSAQTITPPALHWPANETARLLVVGQSASLDASYIPGAAFVPFHTTDSAELPALLSGYATAIEALMGFGLTRLLVPTDGLTAGMHQISVLGCGEPFVALFKLPAGPQLPPIAPLAAALTALGAGGYMLWRRRHVEHAPDEREPTARYSPSAGVTTARRGKHTRDRARLAVVVWDGHEQRIEPIERRQLTVGRDPGCDLRIESEWVSGLHARISVAGDRLEIVDLGSTNGTFVGDTARPLVVGAAEPLALGAVILIGPDVRLSVKRYDEGP